MHVVARAAAAACLAFALSPRSIRAPPVLLKAAASPPPPPPEALSTGHVFVVHGDVRRISADAVLMPTRNLNNKKWFPDGPPSGARGPPRETFTPSLRVQKARTGGPTAPNLWLGHLDGRFAPADWLDAETGGARLEWFLQAAEQFLHAAHADVVASGAPARCRRAKHVLAMPVVGTGKGGARGSSGDMIAGLLALLQRFVAAHDVDVALIVKSATMFSAAQALRRELAAVKPAWRRVLGSRLCARATALAALCVEEQCCLFLGAGVSVGAGLPEWQSLLTAVARRAECRMAVSEVEELRSLPLADQAAYLSSRLGRHSASSAADPASEAECGGGSVGVASGERLLQRLVVDELQRCATWQRPRTVETIGCLPLTPDDCTRRPCHAPPCPARGCSMGEPTVRATWRARRCDLYSITHGLLAGLPVDAVVTTNYDRLFEAAWEGAQAEFAVLPYETVASERFVLKLHGDVDWPQVTALRGLLLLTLAMAVVLRTRRRAVGRT